MSQIPSKFATVDVQYGESKKRLNVPDAESFEFHPDHETAMAAVKNNIEGGSRMVALLRVEALYKAAVSIEAVSE